MVCMRVMLSPFSKIRPAKTGNRSSASHKPLSACTQNPRRDNFSTPQRAAEVQAKNKILGCTDLSLKRWDMEPTQRLAALHAVSGLHWWCVAQALIYLNMGFDAQSFLWSAMQVPANLRNCCRWPVQSHRMADGEVEPQHLHGIVTCICPSINFAKTITC